MNIIVILLDSLRADHLGCYGNSWIETPNIDKLARESVLFENAYPEGLPTIPVRTALFTGQYTLPFRSWQPLSEEDITAAEILSEYGFTSALITDTYHMFKPYMNFHRGFSIFRWIRGQEADAYKSAPSKLNIDDYVETSMKGSKVEKLLEQYLKNIADRVDEEDYFVAQVMQESMQWLEENHDKDQFFLWVDSFDPHEPWDPSAPFDEKYTDPNYTGKKLILPKYGKVDWMTEEQMKYVRGLYAGEVSFVDKWVGRLLEKIGELGLYDNSLIVLLADHGIPLGDHGSMMKTPDNLYTELLKIPLLIRHPEGLNAGKRINDLVQTHDVLPTILDILGLKNEIRSMHGKSVWPVVNGEKDKLRDYIVSGYHDSLHRCVRSKEWSYIFRPGDREDELYDLKEDPKEQNNLLEDYPDKAQEMTSKLGRYFTLKSEKRFHQRQLSLKSLQLKYETSHTSAE